MSAPGEKNIGDLPMFFSRSGWRRGSRGGKTMHPVETIKAKSTKRSLTDQILTLCASGHFGVREAIAAALERSAAAKSSRPTPKIDKEAGTRLPPEQAD